MSGFFSREELVNGLPARRAGTILFAIESRTAHLMGTNLTDANLSSATLERAHLEGANLKNANKSIIFEELPITPKPRVRLSARIAQ